MGAPVTCAHQRLTPRLVRGDQGRRWLRCVQRHLGAAMSGGVGDYEVMDLLAEALEIVLGCDGELPKRPRTRLPQEFDFGGGLRPHESDRCDHFSIEFAHEAVA